ncbi:MFS transporter permease [Halomonas sp. TRM85114]|uniref:DUF6064 family protein n=1 Tax=Halomonas jincaotanensis TaxID=2810616 RepID=UPI001BD323D3|nr:DUF6064 family protein [Halomonas jincaotanensis]MBS9403258.1 MFS transporter permease [Halomonas jincaotanensis]
MSEWWTYRLGDFLMFSPRVYERLFVLYNQALWPAQLLALALGGAILFLLLRPGNTGMRLVMVLLGLAWVFVAWTFLWQRYAPVNLMIPYVAPLFVLQTLLLLGLGTLKSKLNLPAHWSVPRSLGSTLFVYALAVHPWVTAFPTSRGLWGAEVIGLTPDPLAIATLGIAAMANPASKAWLLMVVPALWCLISGLTLLALQAPLAWLPPLAVGMALVARLWPRR